MSSAGSGCRDPPPGRGRFPAKPRPPSHQRGRVSSKADDFDVRYRDGRDGRAWGNGADGGATGATRRPDDDGVLGGTVDYDLGYDANGWDTQGFRSPAAGYLGQPRDRSAGQRRARQPTGGKTAGAAATRTRPAPQRPSTLNWAPEAHRRALAPGSRTSRTTPGSRSSRAWRGRRERPGGPGGPRGPRGQRVKVKGSWWRHWTLRKALGVAARHHRRRSSCWAPS